MVIHLEDNKDKQNRKYKKWFEVAHWTMCKHITRNIGMGKKFIWEIHEFCFLFLFFILVMIISKSVRQCMFVFIFGFCDVFMCVFVVVTSMRVCVHKLFSVQLWNGLKGERLGYKNGHFSCVTSIKVSFIRCYRCFCLEYVFVILNWKPFFRIVVIDDPLVMNRYRYERKKCFFITARSW